MNKPQLNLTQNFRAVQQAGRKLLQLTPHKVNEILMSLADTLLQSEEEIIKENQKDLEKMSLTDPKYDRLKLTEQRIKDIAGEIRNVASLPSPLNKLIEERTMSNGMHIRKISVPLGVIGIIYEARPNVTFDVFSLCIKSGNACILKGGSDAEHSNKAIVHLIRSVLRDHQVTENCIELLPSSREAATALMNAVGYVDVIIPRGSQQLIDHVRQHAKVPVIETGAGIVHAYFDESGDVEKGRAIIVNSKARRVSVCNALDCLLVHSDTIKHLPALVDNLIEKNVIIYADEQAFAILYKHYPAALLQKAEETHYGTEFLDYKLAIRTVASLDEAIDHITTHSSKHSETIISENEEHVVRFLHEVDAAVVYHNVSTAFTDGAQFGLGAEIGISTQKLHARGPMALAEMCSYKWVVRGNGQIRG